MRPARAAVVELARQAEAAGFSHVWTFDSHLLWQEPFVIYSQILAADPPGDGRADGDEPGTRDWTVTASPVRDAERDVRQPDGLRHRPRRLGGAGDQRRSPATLAELRECVEVVRELANGRAVEYRGQQLQFPWAANGRLEVWVAAYGPKALALTGEVGDGYILQLADPDIAAWMIARGPARPPSRPAATRRDHVLRRGAGVRR